MLRSALSAAALLGLIVWTAAREQQSKAPRQAFEQTQEELARCYTNVAWACRIVDHVPRTPDELDEELRKQCSRLEDQAEQQFLEFLWSQVGDEPTADALARINRELQLSPRKQHEAIVHVFTCSKLNCRIDLDPGIFLLSP